MIFSNYQDYVYLREFSFSSFLITQIIGFPFQGKLHAHYVYGLSLLFPSTDFSLIIDENYNPKRLVASKGQIIYDYGAWTNRLDDLWDQKKDRQQGMRQLATEGCVDWRTIQNETQHLLTSLAKYFPRDNIGQVFKLYFKPLLSKAIAERFNS